MVDAFVEDGSNAIGEFGQDGPREVAAHGLGGFALGARQGQQVAFGGAVGVFHSDEGEGPFGYGIVADAGIARAGREDAIHNHCTHDRASLAPEPSARRQPGGQDFALQGFFALALQYFGPIRLLHPEDPFRSRADAREGAHGLEQQPIIAVRPEHHRVSGFGDGRKGRQTGELFHGASDQGGEIERSGLGRGGKIGQDEDHVAFGLLPRLAMMPQEGEDLGIVGLQELQAAGSEHREAAAQLQAAAHPPEQRIGVPLLVLDVHGFVMVIRDRG